MKLNWKKFPLLPAIIQNANTNQVLMLGYMTKQSLQKTLQTKKVWFYSRSKKRLWLKGETSGNFLKVVDLNLDCDSDALLIKALPAGPTCHTGQISCFGRDEAPPRLYEGENFENILKNLYATIQNRKNTLPKNSYTASLFQAGLSKICAKIDEESAEIILAAKQESKQRLIEETSDLLYHLAVLLVAKKVTTSDIAAELQSRQKL